MNRREAVAALLAMGAGAAGAGCAHSGAPRPIAEEPSSGAFFPASVPYVPTRPEVMETMLALAQIGPTDVVYDLGCGDGRLVLAAVKRYGARGLGVDLDGDLVARAQAEAQWQGIEGRARFAAADLFDLDLRPATVVMLYLSVEVNLKLRPRMLEQLRPGSRVVSNRFDMADVWAPERTVAVAGTPVHLWRIPAPRA
jgi:SAM-dependent methyltransferase